MSSIDDKNHQMNNKPNNLVKPTDGKEGAPVQAQQFRTIGPQMRVLMSAGSSIQTHLVPQAMIKQVDASGRTQLTTMPTRTLAQTSITVTRSPTPNTFIPRGPTTIGTPRVSGPSPIRAQTPPTNVTNLTTNFVRSSMPSRTPSPAGTIITPGTTAWMTGSSPVQLIRASIGQSPRTRIVSQAIPQANVNSSGITTISANIVSQSQSGIGVGGVQQNTVQVATASSQQQQPFVATLATVLPPRQQTATLVYSTPQQQFTSTQRLAVATPLSGATGQRQVRPIQIGSARLPTTGIRVSTANISIRGPNIPVLTPTSVLNTISNTVQGRATTVSASNIPGARLIQVQQQQSGGTGGAQVISASRLTGNLMTLHPVIMNTASNNATRTITTAKVQPSLTITHVGKLTSSSGGQLTTTNNLGQTVAVSNIGQTATTYQGTPTQIAISAATGTNQVVTTQQTSNTGGGGGGGNNQQSQQATQIHLQQQQIQQQQNSHQPQQITQIVGINPQGGHGQIIIGGRVPVTATVVPLTLTSRNTNALTGTATVATIPSSVTQLVRGNINVPTQQHQHQQQTNLPSNVLPIAKVLPQQQQLNTSTLDQSSSTSSSVGGNNNIVHQTIVPISSTPSGQNVYIHTRSPNPAIVSTNSSSTIVTTTSSIATSSGGGPFQSTSGATFFYEPITANTTAATGTTVLTFTTTSITNIISSSSSLNSTSNSTGLTTVSSYAPQSSSFAVVPSSNRNIGQIHGMIPISSGSQSQQVQAVPVRFNPLIVENNSTAATNQQNSNQQVSSHQIISLQHQQQQSGQQSSNANVTVGQPTHMIIPVTAKVQSSPSRASILRKRDIDGQTITPKNAAKNLGPTLLSMGNAVPSSLVSAAVEKIRPQSRPGSSDGSTTVSANSSPGVDQQQEHEDLSKEIERKMHRMPDMAFKTVEDMYQTTSGSANAGGTAAGVSGVGLVGNNVGGGGNVPHSQPVPFVFQQQMSTSSSSNGNDEQAAAIAKVTTPKRKSRKQQQNDNQNQSTKKFPSAESGSSSYSSDANKVRSNKENSKPTEVYFKKPRTCTLLDGYKQNWKAANNHFQRYSDVKPREERRQTIMDLANQPHVAQKVNGWKVHHLTSQMEDLAEAETQLHDKFAAMLKCMEAHKSNPDIDRVCDLIKGNMQRNKIVSDGINDAKAQILRIFEHKEPVADIIHRCASKRNFKKREKP